jgi:hypothetical protein
MALEILDQWFETAFEPNEVDNACLAQVEGLERQYLK